MARLLLEIALGLLAALLVAVTEGWWRETVLVLRLRARIQTIRPQWLRLRQDLDDMNTSELTKFLLHWLWKDLSKRGLHRGEFGYHAAIREERLFQTRVTDYASKPRLYLTGWPCLILAELGIGDRALQTCRAGLEQLMADGLVIARATGPSHPETVERIASLRHTIRAAQILYRLKSTHDAVAQTLGRMLDERSGWSHPQGGYLQFEGDIVPDLWATAYAIGFLGRILIRRETSVVRDFSLAERQLRQALSWLRQQWETDKWKYAKACSELNGVQVFHETSEAIMHFDPGFAEILIRWIRGWLTPSGTLTDEYINACKVTGFASCNIRVAYALFQQDKLRGEWKPLYFGALRQFDDRANSADAAFLLHLAQHAHQTGRTKGMHA